MCLHSFPPLGAIHLVAQLLNQCCPVVTTDLGRSKMSCTLLQLNDFNWPLSSALQVPEDSNASCLIEENQLQVHETCSATKPKSAVCTKSADHVLARSCHPPNSQTTRHERISHKHKITAEQQAC